MNQNIYIIILALLSGLGLQRVLGPDRDSAAKGLHTFVIWVALPCLVMTAVPKLHLDSSLLGLIAIPWTLLAASVLLILTVSRLFKLSDGVTGVMLLLGVLGNTAFVGIPFTSAWLGEPAVAYALVFDQFGSFFILTIYGAFILSRYGSGEALSFKRVARRIFTFPPFIALLVALALRFLLPQGLPTELDAAIQRIGGSLVPVVMVAVGIQWKLRVQRSHLLPMGLTLAVKLAFMPLLATWLIRLYGVEGLAGQTAILEASMGPMISAGALASNAGMEGELAATIVGYGTLIALGTCSLVALTLASG